MGDTLSPNSRCFTEHLVFLLLLLPTFVVLAAAVVSLASPEPSVSAPATQTAALSCEPCWYEDGRAAEDAGPY